MRKISFIAKTLLVPSCLLISSMAASAEDGTVTFTGNISDTTCIVTIADANGTGIGDYTVKLKDVSTTALAKAGERAGDTDFKFQLSGTNCTNGKYANVSFERALSQNIDGTTGNLKNHTAAGAAKNVQVGLSDESKNPIDLRQQITDATKGKQITNNTAEFTYWAQYVATGDAASAGSVHTDVVYSIIYQ
ncbi:fimbrial protein [Nissabacter sp. SGAir0207]|uniref:fimbrial protein n=1 Tax=Nissabacter sp. SGAir0207 TaxID=2126321 RepID=UPI0010CCBAE3|nr:fimbrial protein [Nissabacter sp. SGAir0207]QCR34967.1 type 1 fimbrial protein [Nissabacter sp. SGAir0207]